jgi:hypothetical protein
MEHIAESKDDGGHTSVLGFVRRKLRRDAGCNGQEPQENPFKTDSMQSFVSSSNDKLKRSSTIRVRAKDHTIHQQAATKVKRCCSVRARISQLSLMARYQVTKIITLASSSTHQET